VQKEFWRRRSIRAKKPQPIADGLIDTLPSVYVELRCTFDEIELFGEGVSELLKGRFGREGATKPGLVHLRNVDGSDRRAARHQAPSLAHGFSLSRRLLWRFGPPSYQSIFLRRGTLAPMTRRRLKLIFGSSLVKEPVIYQLGRKFEIVTNIRRADVSKDQGWVLLEVSGEPDELDKGVEYLESRGVKVEPAEGDLVE
jgi:L-aspartate semialdehyde sulfurtransferase ferredoxin